MNTRKVVLGVSQYEGERDAFFLMHSLEKVSLLRLFQEWGDNLKSKTRTELCCVEHGNCFWIPQTNIGMSKD